MISSYHYHVVARKGSKIESFATPENKKIAIKRAKEAKESHDAVWVYDPSYKVIFTIEESNVNV